MEVRSSSNSSTGTRVASWRAYAGRPRKRPAHLIADRGYSFRGCRNCYAGGAFPTPSPSAKTSASVAQRRPGRRPGFDREAYRRRNVVERCVGRLKQWRSVATRYEKRAVNYRRGGSRLADDLA